MKSKKVALLYRDRHPKTKDGLVRTHVSEELDGFRDRAFSPTAFARAGG